ncbi:MAG: hypothetical protein J1E98_03440 [Lachnospiraceae bacterium]|nr:hypothetical protein [Lachnospiraceae bacterium]
MLKKIKINSKEVFIIVICLFAVILVYASYLYIYGKGGLDDYLSALLKYFIVSIPLSYALCNFIGGKEKRRLTLIGLFAAYFVLILDIIERESDYQDLILYFWPLITTTCFLAIMIKKIKSKKHFMMSMIPLILIIVAIGFYVRWRELLNLLIIPLWLVQFFGAAIYLTLAFGDYDKFKIRVQRLVIVFCLFQTWIIYDGLLIGYMPVKLFQQLLVLVWPVFVFAVFNLSKGIKGIGRLFICYVIVFIGMWLLEEPYLSSRGLKWETVETLYLLLTADLVIIIENHRQHQSSKKMHEYGVIVLMNAGYLIFLVLNSWRIKNILHSLFNENSWGSFRMEALRVNISGDLDAAILGKMMVPSLSEMNLNVGIWLPIIIIALTCIMIYAAVKSHCENETAELIKKYLCYSFLLRIILSVFANLFLLSSSLIDFPLLVDGEEDIAVMVMVFLCLYIKQQKTVKNGVS